MWRVLVEPAPLFIMAALATVAYFVIRGFYPVAADHWSHSALAAVALVCLAAAIISLLALGVFAERHAGAYIPAHIENGKLVPGRME